MSDTDRVWEFMKKIGICMLTSWDGQELQARPMAAYVRPEQHAVFFLTDARHQKDDDIKRYSKVCLAFADTGAPNYAARYLNFADALEALFDRPVDVVIERSIRNPHFRRAVEATRQHVYDDRNTPAAA